MAIACPNSIARPVAGPGCRRGVARAPAESSGAAATAHDGGHGGGEQDDCRNRRTDLHSPEGSYGRLITRAVPRVALDCLAVDSGKLLHGPGLDFGWCTIPDMAQSASTAAAWLPACGHRTCWWGITRTQNILTLQGGEWCEFGGRCSASTDRCTRDGADTDIRIRGNSSFPQLATSRKVL
jgi:hypothetical protein